MNAVGSHIRKLRKQQNLSQEALAKKLNVTRQAVSQWENGITQPDLDTLERIAREFDVDMMEVIYGDKKATSSYPTLRCRKKYIIRCIAFAILTLMAIAVLKVLQPNTAFSQDIPLSFSVYTIFYEYILFYLEPIFYLSISVSALCGASLVWDMRICRRSVKLGTLFVALTMILLYYGCGLIYHGGVLPKLLYDFEVFADSNPAIFILPGIGLFFGLNGCKAKARGADAGVQE